MLLLLPGIAVFTQVLGHFVIVPWFLHKTMELKLYALIVSGGVVLMWTGQRYASHFLQTQRNLYTLYWCIALPVGIIINSIFSLGIRRVDAVFLMALLGAAVLWVDCTDPTKRPLEKIAERCFPLSIALSIILICLLTHQNTLSPISIIGALTFCTVFALLRFTQKGWPAFLDPLLLFFILIFVCFTFFGIEANIPHYSFYLGPVVEMFYGHKHPFVELNAQYGGGVTWFLTQYMHLWGHVWNGGLNLLLKAMMITQYLILFFLSLSLLRSRVLSFGVVFAVLVFCCLSQAEAYFAFPSIGPLRFGHIFLILLLYTLPLGERMKNVRMHACALIAAIATLWSFESFLYTVPAWMAAEMWSGRGKNALLQYAGYTAALLFLFVLPPLLQGQHVDLYRYIEFSAVYAGGFGQIRLDNVTNLWWLFPLLYILIILEVIWKKEKDIRVLMLAIYGLATFTYFCGRAVPNNLHHIALPFILLSVYWLQRSTLPWKKIAISGWLTVFLTANFSLFDKGMIVWPLMTTWNRIHVAGLHDLLPWARHPADDNNGSCTSALDVLRPYIYEHSIALIDQTVELYMYYDCLHITNALNADPWLQIGISPRAIARLKERAAEIQSPFILVGDDLTEDPLAKDILAITHAKKVREISLNDHQIFVYERLTANALPPGKEQEPHP